MNTPETTDVEALEQEREHFAQVARDTFAELRIVTAERDAALARLAPAPEPTDVEALLAGELTEAERLLLVDATEPFEDGGFDNQEFTDGILVPLVERILRTRAAALVPLVAQQRADALREAADEWDAAGTVPRSILGNWLRERADRIAPTTEEGQR